MQVVTDTYKSLWASPHSIEVMVSINGVDYDSSQIYSMSTTRQIFNENTPVIGSCVSSEIDLEIINPQEAIPPMAEIKPYVRIVGDGGTSEWICKGVYYIDTRQNTKNPYGVNRLTIHGYDAMLKLSGQYAAVNPSASFPMNAAIFLYSITQTYGIQYDTSQAYTLLTRLQEIVITNPQKRTFREILGYIGMKLSGNWIIDEINAGSPDKTYGLKFVQFGNYDDGQDGLLIDENGNYITIGGDKIIV